MNCKVRKNDVNEDGELIKACCNQNDYCDECNNEDCHESCILFEKNETCEGCEFSN